MGLPAATEQFDDKNCEWNGPARLTTDKEVSDEDCEAVDSELSRNSSW